MVALFVDHNFGRVILDRGNLKAKPEKEDFAHKYTEEGQGFIGSKLISGYFRAVKELLKISKKLDAEGQLTAIELGCGEGFSTQKIQTMLPGNVRLYASEYVENLVVKARRRSPEIMIIRESVYELTHKDGSFDIVFLLEVLEHLDYPQTALKEIWRVLKNDGVLILGVPREPLWRILNITRGKYLIDLGNTVGHLNHWSAKSLVELFVKHLILFYLTQPVASGLIQKQRCCGLISSHNSATVWKLSSRQEISAFRRRALR